MIKPKFKALLTSEKEKAITVRSGIQKMLTALEMFPCKRIFSVHKCVFYLYIKNTIQTLYKQFCVHLIFSLIALI